MLKRISEIDCKVDNSGTITFNLGNGWILKGSPTEILIIADKIIKLLTQDVKLKTAESIYMQTLKALDIPDDVVREIQRRLNGTKHDPEQPTNIKEETNDTKAINIKKEHIMLYQFVTAFVNSETSENEFEAEEFSVFDHEIKSLPKILGEYGFKVKIKDNTILISLDGEHNNNEQQYTNNRP